MKSISILRLTAILLCSMHLLGSASLQAQMNKWVNYSPDLTTVLKNPAMGWMMYEEGWSFQGTRHIKATSIPPKFFGSRWKNARLLIMPIYYISECYGKIWNLRARTAFAGRTDLNLHLCRRCIGLNPAMIHGQFQAKQIAIT